MNKIGDLFYQFQILLQLKAFILANGAISSGGMGSGMGVIGPKYKKNGFFGGKTTDTYGISPRMQCSVGILKLQLKMYSDENVYKFASTCSR